MRPNSNAHETDRQGRAHHDRITKNCLARENRNDLRREGENGEHQDVHFGMAENPEKEHPEYHGATGSGVEKMRPKKPFQKHHELDRLNPPPAKHLPPPPTHTTT